MKVFYILPFLVLFACGTEKELVVDDTVEVTEEEVDETPKSEFGTIRFNIAAPENVHIAVSHYTPHCGGEAPNPDDEPNRTQPQSNTTFVVVNLETYALDTVQADANGVVHLRLETGKYALREMYKNCTFEEFLQQNQGPTNEYYGSAGGPNCYEDWWAANLIEINVANVETTYNLEASTQSRCFVGMNPCLSYNGPWPP